MKKILVFVCCLLAPVLMAQSSGYVTRSIPADVYEALLVVNGEKSDSNMTLTQAKETVKGTIVLEAGYPACPPCQKMILAIEEELIPVWQSKGVSFYQLQSIRDEKEHAAPKLIDWMKDEAQEEGVPLLFVLKDGKVAAMYKGYDSTKRSDFVSNLKQVTL